VYSRFGPYSFLLFAILIPAIGLTLAAFARIIQVYLAITYSLWFELAMVTGQVLFQWVALLRNSWRDRFDYAWILILVSSLGAVLLWPLLAWNASTPVAPFTAVLYFMGVVAVLFAAHAWLVHRVALPLYLCATWVLYRLAILWFAVKF
jgi:hypothetical protein